MGHASEALRTVRDRFFDLIAPVDGPMPEECWISRRASDQNRRWNFWVNPGMTQASRWAYRHLLRRPIGKNIVIGQTCGNPGCVNPAHLIALTKSEVAHENAAEGKCRKGGRHKRTVVNG